MKFRYNSLKAIQAGSIVLHRLKENVSFKKIKQLLYLADRSSLIEWGSPMTGETFVNTSDGPALTNGCEWASTDMDIDELSRYETNTLEKLCDIYSEYKDNEMTKLFHSLVERKNPTDDS